MTITVHVTLAVISVMFRELVQRTEPLDIVDLGAMLLAFRMYLHTDAVSAHNTARYTSLRLIILEILTALPAILLAHHCRLYAALQRKRDDLRPVRWACGACCFGA